MTEQPTVFNIIKKRDQSFSKTVRMYTWDLYRSYTTDNAFRKHTYRNPDTEYTGYCPGERSRIRYHRQLCWQDLTITFRWHAYTSEVLTFT